MKKYETITTGAPEKLGKRVAKSGTRKLYTNTKRTASKDASEPLYCTLTYRDYIPMRYGRGNALFISSFIKERLNKPDFLRNAVKLESMRDEQLTKSCTMYLSPDTASLIRKYSEINSVDMSIILRYIAWCLRFTEL